MFEEILFWFWVFLIAFGAIGKFFRFIEADIHSLKKGL